MDMRKLKTDIKELLVDPASPGDLKVSCALSLGRFRTETAVEPLIHALDAPDADLRAAAVKALGLIGDPAAGPPLLSMWDGADPGLRKALRLALWRVSEKPGAGRLRELLAQSDEASPPVVHVIDKRLELQRGVTPGHFLPLLTSESPEARRDAAFLLGLTGTEADAMRLELLAEEEENPGVRTIEESAAAAIAARHAGGK
jgi:HEAT repeat protein